MKNRWALLLALVGVCGAQQFNHDIIPTSTGLKVGHSNQRWDGFFRNMDISGTCNINGVPCGSGGGGTSIATYHVANLPPSPPVNTAAFVDDANGASCTIGGAATHNMCQFTGFQWVLVSGGSGGSASWSTLTGGTALGQTFFVGNSSSFSAIGSGSISATNVPISKVAVLHQWFDSYDSVGKTFHSSQPTYPDLTGIPRIDEIQTSTSNPWLLFDTSSGAHQDGLKFTFTTGSLLMQPVGSSTNVQVELDAKGSSPLVLGNSAGGVTLGNVIKIPSIISSCLETGADGTVHAASGGLCGSGGGSVTYPLNAPDGSTSSPQYSFTNHPELGMATWLDGDKPQIRQVVVSGAGPGQTITLTVSSPINNLSWNAGDRIILSSLPSSPTDLTSLNITSPSSWVISSVTSTSPTGTATFSTASTTITPGTYAVTSGNAQIYGGFLVGRGFGFNRLESTTTNPSQSGSIRFARRDAIKARAGFSDDTTVDVAHLRGSAQITPTNTPGTGIMTVNGAQSSGASTISVAKQAGTNWSAVAGDAIIVVAGNGDSDNQKYVLTANATVTQGTNTTLSITPNLKTALNGGELVVTRYIRTQVGEETGVELPGDTELKGDLTLTSTKPTLIQVKKQSSSPTLNTSYDAGWYLDSTNHFACKLSVALGGGSCAPTGSGGGYSTIQDEAVALAAETTVNFTGAGVTCVDNPGSSRTDCTIPGGSGVSGSGTTKKFPVFTGAGSIGDGPMDYDLTTAATVTINATGGLNILGSGVAAVVALKPGTTPSVVAGNIGFAGPSSVTTAGLIQLPGAYSVGFLSAGTPSSNVYPGLFRTFSATSPITVTNADGSGGNPTYACATCGVTGTGLGQFAATTSALLAGVISDEIGSGKLVFASAYQGSGANVMSAGTVANNNTLCSATTGEATTSNCNNLLYGTSGSSVSQLSSGVLHIAGSTNVVTSSAVNLAGGSSEVTGVLPLANIAQPFVVNAQTTTYQVLAADFAACKTITTASASFTVTLVASGSQPVSGQCIDIVNYGSGTVTVARSGQNINGAAANLTIPAASASAPTSLHVVSDGTNYFAETMGTGTAAGVTSFTGDANGIISNSGSTGGVTVSVAGTSGGIVYFDSATSWNKSAALTANSPVLGGGAGVAPKVVAGITTDGTSKIVLGVAGSSVGSVDFKNATSGTMNIAPPTGALGTINIVGPPASGTMMMTNTNVAASQMPALTGDCTTSAGAVAVTCANEVTAASNATAANQLAVAAGANKALSYIDFPDVKIIPAANCVNAVAGSGWSSTGTGMPAACRAGSNNFNGVLQPIPSTGGTGYFETELPADWSTGVKPYISIYYGSGANTSGTVIWTVSTACTKQDGSVTDDPSWIAESAMGTQTMSAASRMWAQNAQISGAMTNCIAGSTFYIKVVLSGTASSAINVSKAVITIPRRPVVQAN